MSHICRRMIALHNQHPTFEVERDLHMADGTEGDFGTQKTSCGREVEIHHTTKVRDLVTCPHCLIRIA